MARGTRSARVGIALIIVTLIVIAGVGANYLSSVPKGMSTPSSTSGSTRSSTSSSATTRSSTSSSTMSDMDMPAVQLDLVASSSGNLFVGTVGGNGYLYVGLLNGIVEKMDPQSGRIMATVTLPDRNSAAHLLYYNGSLYVGTESLRGAKNTPPYYIYRIDPQAMQILTQVAMFFSDANGFVFAYNGYLWAGDGGCTLYKFKPDTLSVINTVPSVAEDEMIYDGTHYWTECGSTVSVLKSDSALTIVATGTMPYPARPRGFFEIGSSIYSTDSANFTLYRMSISGNKVIFKNMGALGNYTLGTRDTLSTNGLLYTYQTRDNTLVQARILVDDGNLSLEAAITLPGYGLPTDASQHSMLLFDGIVYFVTTSAIGYFAPLDAQTL